MTFRHGVNRSKFNVDLSPEGKARRTYKGITFRSDRELSHARQLELEKRTGTVADWSYEPYRVPLVVNGVKIGTYTPDFVVTLPSGSIEVHEVKGRETAEWRLKYKLIQATWLKENPSLVFKVIR